MNNNYFKTILTKIKFNKEDIDYLESCYSNILKKNKDSFNKYINRFKNNDDYEEIFSDFRKEYYGIYHEYTLDMILLIVLSEPLKEMYIEKNIPINVFYDTLEDLRYKLEECKKVYRVIGTFVYWWFEGIYNLTIFKLGRLEYEYHKFEGDYNKNGITIKNNDDVITIHIPNSGEKLTKESVIDSIKKANEFYKKKVIYVCSSWLLYYKSKERYKEGSNLLDFFNMFDIYDNRDHDSYGELWRVFDTEIDDNNIDNLKADTSLQRIYLEVMKRKEKIGTGYGVLLKEYY